MNHLIGLLRTKGYWFNKLIASFLIKGLNFVALGFRTLISISDADTNLLFRKGTNASFHNETRALLLVTGWHLLTEKQNCCAVDFKARTPAC